VGRSEARGRPKPWLLADKSAGGGLLERNVVVICVDVFQTVDTNATTAAIYRTILGARDEQEK
jgi:hypothetical protein